VHEKLIIFPYVQYIVGIYISLAFRRCTEVRGRCWVLRAIGKNVTVDTRKMDVSLYGAAATIDLPTNFWWSLPSVTYCQITVKKRQIIVTQTKYATFVLIVCWLLMYNPTLLTKNNRLVGLHKCSAFCIKIHIMACQAKAKFKVSVWT